MCLYVFVSRGCFRHRSALANGFFVASISIPFALFVSLSLSLTCSFVLSVSYFPTNYNNSALRRSLSLSLQFFLSKCFRCVFFLGRYEYSLEAMVCGKFNFQKVSPIETSLTLLFRSIYARTNTRNKIRFASFVCLTRSCVFSLSL